MKFLLTTLAVLGIATPASADDCVNVTDTWGRKSLVCVKPSGQVYQDKWGVQQQPQPRPIPGAFDPSDPYKGLPTVDRNGNIVNR